MSLIDQINALATRLATEHNRRTRSGHLRPTTGFENIPRAHGNMGNQAILTSGREFCSRIFLKAGSLTTVTFYSATTALATGTAQWATVRDSSGTLLTNGQSADRTNTAWAAFSGKSFTFTSLTIPSDGEYYIGLMVAATTVPSLTGVSMNTAAIGSIAPTIFGEDITARTTTAETTVTLVAQQQGPYLYAA